jgi:hypothetical protein
MMKLIHLDLQQRKEIERRRHATRGRRIYEWLSVVLLVAGGKDRSDVATPSAVVSARSPSGCASTATRVSMPVQRGLHITHFTLVFLGFQGFSGGKSDTSEALAVQR